MWAAQPLQVSAASNIEYNNSVVKLEGFQNQTALLPSIKDAERFVLYLLYGGDNGIWQTREKYKRNAEIYRRYLAGEDSVTLGQAFGLSDRRVRDIIEKQRRIRNSE